MSEDAYATNVSGAGIAYNVTGAGPPVLFVHGLTFDSRTWTPVLRRLGERVTSLVVDLPGHGRSPAWPTYDTDAVIDALHATVAEAGLSHPVVVGHSISGLLAFEYAARYPAAAVIDVNMVLDLTGFAELVRSLASQLRGPDFAELWQQFENSMRLDLIPAPDRSLVEASMRADQHLVLGYWAPLFDTPVGELVARVDATLAAVTAPAAVVYGAELEPNYRRWLVDRSPRIAIHEWPNSGHFPHLVHPDDFIDVVLSLAGGIASAAQ